ncbi:MAG: hypothetical protein KBT13_05775 [Bacteroidales bacterium]|nr:hypothetical protein [Candidatus Sodaliphilus limicaballi]
MNDIYWLVQEIMESLVTLGICVVLPITVVYMTMRKRKHETDKRNEIALAVIEKNGNIDVQDIIKSLTPPQKSLKERLIMKMHYELIAACILTIFAVAIFIALVVVACMGIRKEDIYAMGLIFGIPSLAVGVSLFIGYRTSKKMLSQLDD